MKGYIYKIETPTGKFYIGQTINFEKRLKNYKNGNFYKQLLLWNDSKKYNYNPSEYMSIIEEVDYDPELLVDGENLLDLREIFWINQIGSYHYESVIGLNLTKGGRTRKGYVASIETRKKQRLAKLDKPGCRLGQKHTQETIDKLSRYKGENHWNLGGSVSEETKMKISESQKGEKHWNFGGKLPEETKMKISETLKGRPMAEKSRIKFNQNNEKRKRRVVIDGVVYDSINGAARELNLQPQTVLNRCKSEKFNNYNFIEDSLSK